MLLLQVYPHIRDDELSTPPAVGMFLAVLVNQVRSQDLVLAVLCVFCSKFVDEHIPGPYKHFGGANSSGVVSKVKSSCACV